MVESCKVIPPSLSNTPSTVTPTSSVYSLMVSTATAPVISASSLIVTLPKPSTRSCPLRSKLPPIVIVLLVKVCVASKVTNVSLTSGIVKVRVVPVVNPESSNCNCLVVSSLSWKKVVESLITTPEFCNKTPLIVDIIYYILYIIYYIFK